MDNGVTWFLRVVKILVNWASSRLPIVRRRRCFCAIIYE